MTAAALVTLFLGLLTYGLTTSGRKDAIDGRLNASKPASAPPFELPILVRGRPGELASRLAPALADGRIGTEELRGVPVVLNFWASWCPPCRTEAPVLERSWRLARRSGALILGLNMQDVSGDARAFVRELGISYPNVRDRSDAVARKWGVAGLPETFFLDRRGRVVGHVVGAISRRQLQEGSIAARTGRASPARSGGDRRSTR